MQDQRKRPRYEPEFAVEDIARLGREGEKNIFTGSPDQMLALLKNRMTDTYGALVDVAGQRDAATANAKKAKAEAVEAQRAVVERVEAVLVVHMRAELTIGRRRRRSYKRRQRALKGSP